jgi:hypothetical protein
VSILEIKKKPTSENQQRVLLPSYFFTSSAHIKATMHMCHALRVFRGKEERELHMSVSFYLSTANE